MLYTVCKCWGVESYTPHSWRIKDGQSGVIFSTGVKKNRPSSLQKYYLLLTLILLVEVEVGLGYFDVRVRENVLQLLNKILVSVYSSWKTF
jgi:hypothetical protein